MYFHYFVIISPWNRTGTFIWTNLNPLHPRMLCAKCGWNWLSGSREEDYSFLSMYFCYIIIISPWERAGSFIWTNLNPLHPRILWPSLVDIGSVVLKKIWKCEQFLPTTTTDNGEILIRKAHLRLWRSWAKKNAKKRRAKNLNAKYGLDNIPPDMIGILPSITDIFTATTNQHEN